LNEVEFLTGHVKDLVILLAGGICTDFHMSHADSLSYLPACHNSSAALLDYAPDLSSLFSSNFNSHGT
jgi:hypothetical protein